MAMTDLIKHWRKEFGLTIDGDLSQANLDLFLRLFLEEVEEVLREVADDNKPQVQILFATIKNIKNNAEHFTLDEEEINVAALEKELSDLDYITYGHGWLQLGLRREETHIKTYLSNMSKLCITEEDAKLSCSDKNPHLKCDPSETAYKLSKSGYYIIYNVNTGKVLKGINYKSVEEYE